MIGLHTNNFTRPNVANKARPFLNTLFVIDLLKKEWAKIANTKGGKNAEAKGILIYNENGESLSYVPAGRADLIYENCNFEATMIKNRNQQLNSETTSVARHLWESKKRTQNLARDLEQDLANEQRAVLIAPIIHFDVALFFKFCAREFESKLAPISISNFIDLIEQSATFSEFLRNFDTHFVDRLLCEKTDSYIASVNYAKGN